MDKIICQNCGTENEPDYIFCKQCAAELNGDGQSTSRQAPPYQNVGYGGQPYGNQPPYGYAPFGNQPPYGYYPYQTETIDGVKTEDVAAFIGSAAPTYIPKFAKMEMTRSTVSFNWLVALISIFVSPFFAACWFIHKRMNKIGLIIFAIVALAQGAYIVTVFPTILDLLEKVAADGFSASVTDLVYIATRHNTAAMLASNAFNIVTYAVAILGGLFANHMYKSHIIKTVKSIKAQNEQEYRAELIRRGGTKNALWICLLVGLLVALFLFVLFIQ